MAGDRQRDEPMQVHSASEAPKQAHAEEPTRVRQFLTFFKNYMSLSALVVAALPIPATMLGFIPTYVAHTKLLTVYTSLFCFLLLGFVFYSRHSLAKRFFPMVVGGDGRPSKVAWAYPLFFIILSVVLVFSYQYLLEQSATKYVRESLARKWEIIFNEYPKRLKEQGIEGTEVPLHVQSEIMQQLIEEVGLLETGRSMEEELKNTPIEGIPYGLGLIALYLGFFLAAEAAFAIMALKEYLQDLLELSDLQLIAPSKHSTAISGRSAFGSGVESKL